MGLLHSFCVEKSEICFVVLVSKPFHKLFDCRLMVSFKSSRAANDNLINMRQIDLYRTLN